MHSEDFDFVIVGAGSAGCVLANRLSADGRHSVCLIEAGGENTHLFVTMPMGYGRAVGNPQFDWCYTSEPAPGLNNRSIAVPRGKVLGGSSSINAMAYVRGHQNDFVHWRQLGNVGWSWEDVLRTYRRIEDFDEAEGALRFKGGAMPVRRARHVHPLSRKIIEASVEAGLPSISDYNTPDPEGLSIAQINADKGRRASAAAAYLKPARTRANLRVITGAEAQRLHFKNRRAEGVEVIHNGAPLLLRARREIILSAGAVNSPLLLESSGVGQGARLKELGIEVVHELTGVGENLQDHYFSGVRMRVRDGGSLNQEMRMPRLALNAVRYALFRTGILATTLSQLTGYARVSPESSSSDIQFFGSASTMRAAMRPKTQEMRIEIDPEPGANLGCYVCRPEGRGATHIIARERGHAPRIFLNHLSHPRDQEIMVKGLRLCRRILEQPALAPFRAAILSPGEDLQSDAQLLDFARNAGGSAFHLVGTCAMGAGDKAVVDARLKVQGLEGLRVVDASIMPTLVSANTHAATVVIAERGAEFILEDAA